MRIVIDNEPINKYIYVDRLECEFVDLPKMRAALFAICLKLDDEIIKFNENPDTWVATETKRLFEETLANHHKLGEEVKS